MRHPALLFPVDPLRHCAQEVLHERGHAAVARGVDALAELAHGLVLDLALPHRRREQGGRGGAHLALDEVVPAFVHKVLAIVFVAGWLTIAILEYTCTYSEYTTCTRVLPSLG